MLVRSLRFSWNATASLDYYRIESHLTKHYIALSAVFYGSGFQSVDEASQAFTSWGQRKRRQIEAASIDLGVDDHPDAIAVKNMSEEEEMEYFQTKYMRGIEKRVSVWSWERARADEMNAASDDRMNEID